MTDRNGQPIVVGDRVRFNVGDYDVVWRRGTVRSLGKGHFENHARCDDGDPSDSDLNANGFRVSAWVPSRDIELIPRL